MDTYRRSGIVTGILFIIADVAGFLSIIAQPIINAPDYLTKISANEPTVLAGALLVFIMGWADAGIGISIYPILRRHNEGLALGAAGFRIIDGVLVCIGAVLILLLTTLSREFIKAGPAASGRTGSSTCTRRCTRQGEPPHCPSRCALPSAARRGSGAAPERRVPP